MKKVFMAMLMTLAVAFIFGMLKKDSEPDTEDEGEILVDDEEDILSDAE